VNDRRAETSGIEARRARPSETTRSGETRSRRESMPVDVSPRRSASNDSDDRTARRVSDDPPAPRATRAEPRSEPRSQPRAEPRSAPRSEPRAAPRSSGGDHGGWSGGGDGGRRGGGGGGVSSSGGGRRR
jgi:hypothetical protein